MRLSPLATWDGRVLGMVNCCGRQNKRLRRFVTGDKTVVYEQNLTGAHLAVVALSVNNWPIIKERISEIFAAIGTASPGSFEAVDCGKFSRKKTRGSSLE